MFEFKRKKNLFNHSGSQETQDPVGQSPHSRGCPRKSVAFESKMTAKEGSAVLERAPASVSEMATASAAAKNWQGDLGFSISERTVYLAMLPFLFKYLGGFGPDNQLFKPV